MTFSDPGVAARLSRDFVCYWENQVPGMYREKTYPAEMLARCPEGAGGHNVQHFLCDPDGTVRAYFAGYWKPERFLKELGPHDHATEPPDKRRDYLVRLHEQGAPFVGRPVGEILRTIAEEVYTKGKTG